MTNRKLARREQEIMDVLHAAGRATAHEVRERIVSPPSYSAIRALLAILERKGHVKHAQDGPRYVYFPALSKQQASKHAVAHLLEVFFGGSAERAMGGLMAGPSLGEGVVEQRWDPSQVNLDGGWRARSEAFAQVGNKGLERIVLEVWWMSGSERRTFQLEAYRPVGIPVGGPR